MILHILPAIATVVTIYRQGYNHAWFTLKKDQMYGIETITPTLMYVAFLIIYYGAFLFFKLIA